MAALVPAEPDATRPGWRKPSSAGGFPLFLAWPLLPGNGPGAGGRALPGGGAGRLLLLPGRGPDRGGFSAAHRSCRSGRPSPSRSSCSSLRSPVAKGAGALEEAGGRRLAAGPGGRRRPGLITAAIPFQLEGGSPRLGAPGRGPPGSTGVPPAGSPDGGLAGRRPCACRSTRRPLLPRVSAWRSGTGTPHLPGAAAAFFVAGYFHADRRPAPPSACPSTWRTAGP